MERNRVGVGRTTLHGYDGQHRKMRRYFKPIVEAGAAPLLTLRTAHPSICSLGLGTSLRPHGSPRQSRPIRRTATPELQ